MELLLRMVQSVVSNNGIRVLVKKIIIVTNLIDSAWLSLRCRIIVGKEVTNSRNRLVSDNKLIVFSEHKFKTYIFANIFYYDR